MEKIAIVTGASGNLGSAVVQKFIENNYQVTGIVHKKKSSAKEGEANYQEEELDLLNPADCESLVQKITSEKGKIDVAVLTAGGFTRGDIKATSIKDITDQYRLNFETAYNIARPVFLEMMKQNYGRIFLVGSRAGYDTNTGKGVTAYALSKSLLFSLADIMNAEAHQANVVVSVIVPSIIDTPQNRTSMPQADFTKWVDPSEIAEIIYFYSSDKASSIREPVIKVYKNS